MDIDPETITDESALFGDQGLGLDSMDALERVVLLDRGCGIKVENPEEVRGNLYH